MSRHWPLAAVVVAFAIGATVDARQTSLTNDIDENPPPPMGGDMGASSLSTTITALNQMTANVLGPYGPVATTPPQFASNISGPSGSPIMTARFCYQIMLMEDRDTASIVVRKPKLQSCHSVDFPRHTQHLGDAEIVLDLNEQPVVVGSQIVDISISPTDEKIAYACSKGELYSSLTLAVRSLVEEGPPLILTQNFQYPMFWEIQPRPGSPSTLRDRGGFYLYYTAISTSGRQLELLRHGAGGVDEVMYSMPLDAGYFSFSATKHYFFVAISNGKAENEVMVARRSGANIVWHPVTRVPSDKLTVVGDLDGGVTVIQQDYLTGRESLWLFIPNAALDNVLQGRVLQNEELQSFNSSNSQDMVVLPNGECLLRFQRDDSSGASQLIAHRVISRTDESGKQSTMLNESLPIRTQIPAGDLGLSSMVAEHGTRAVLSYFGVLTKVQVYSLDCSANALVLERVSSYQGFDAEPYHESVETTLTPGGSPVSWRLLYRKDMVRRNGANPLVLIPDHLFRVNYFDGRQRYIQEIAELMDKGFIFALATIDKDSVGIFGVSLPNYLDAIKRNVVQLETVINHALRLNLAHADRVAVVAADREAAALAIFMNRKPNLLQAAVLKKAPLSASALAVDQSRDDRLASRHLAQILDPTAHLPLNGTSTNILVLEAEPLSISAESAIKYVSTLQQNSKNTGLALLDVSLTNNRPHEQLLLKSPLTKPFLLRTLCPNWLINQTCV